MTKTALEFYRNGLYVLNKKGKLKFEEENELFEQAKKMFEAQITNAFVEGADTGEMFNNERRAFITDAEQYYDRNFKSE